MWIGANPTANIQLPSGFQVASGEIESGTTSTAWVQKLE